MARECVVGRLYEPRGHEVRMARVVEYMAFCQRPIVECPGPLVWLADLWFEIVRDWDGWNRIQKAPGYSGRNFFP